MSATDAASGSDKTEEVPVDGWGVVALGAYLVAFTLILVIIIWQLIPSCDVAGVVVTGLSPSRAVTTGGEQVRIAGQGFGSEVTVRVSDRNVPASVISPVEILITTPSMPVGRANVTVFQKGFPPMDVPGGLVYEPTGPIVRRVVPSVSLTAGGESLQILGDRFKGGARVRIGTLDPIAARVESPSELVVTTPKMPAAGVVDIVVSQGAESATFAGGLQFVDARPPATASAPLVVSTIEPSMALITGGQEVAIIGSGFTSDTSVRFGGVPARSRHVDGTRFITAVTPMHAAGAVSVTVGNDQSLASLDGKFSFVCPPAPEPTMVLMVLLAGALGGLVHALRSFFWYVGERKLLLNWVPMYVLLPFSSAALGFVFYLVIRAGLFQPTAGTSLLLVGLAALVGMFSAQATEKLKGIAEGIFTKPRPGSNAAPPADATSPMTAPTIASIKPTSGPLTENTLVTLTGTGFTAQSIVRFGQTVSPEIVHVSATTLRAVAPPSGASGVVDVAVKVGARETVKERAYTYATPKGTITGVTPKEGAPAGGTTVTIKGDQFAGNVAVSFGDALAVAPKVVDSSTIEAITPPQPAGKVDVRVDAGADLIAVATKAFEYK